MDGIFQAKTRRTVEKRYAELIGQREKLVQAEPRLQPGFDSLETARCYLHLFELTCRLTPFGPQVQPHLRGKCPLELAGYDLTQAPLARYLRDGSQSLALPGRCGEQAEVVPK